MTKERTNKVLPIALTADEQGMFWDIHRKVQDVYSSRGIRVSKAAVFGFGADRLLEGGRLHPEHIIIPETFSIIDEEKTEMIQLSFPKQEDYEQFTQLKTALETYFSARRHVRTTITDNMVLLLATAALTTKQGNVNKETLPGHEFWQERTSSSK